MNEVSGYGGYTPYSSYHDLEVLERKSAIDGLLHEIEHDGSESVKKLREIRQEIESENH